MANHVPGCLFLHSKKLLFLSMSNYYKKYIILYADYNAMFSKSFLSLSLFPREPLILNSNDFPLASKS